MFRVVGCVEDQVSHVADRAMRAGNIPPAPPLAERAGQRRAVVAGIKQRLAGCVGKQAAHHQARHIMGHASFMTLQAGISLSMELRLFGTPLAQPLETRPYWWSPER